jgi:hypothetical protein
MKTFSVLCEPYQAWSRHPINHRLMRIDTIHLEPNRAANQDAQWLGTYDPVREQESFADTLILNLVDTIEFYG